MTDRLTSALRDLRRARIRSQRRSPATPTLVVEERLNHLERQMTDVQRRVTGLLFVLLGAVATNLILGLAR